MPFKPMSEPISGDFVADHKAVMDRFPGRPLHTFDDAPEIGDTREVPLDPNGEPRRIRPGEPPPADWGSDRLNLRVAHVERWDGKAWVLVPVKRLDEDDGHPD
jgi:hypothetical protein